MKAVWQLITTVSSIIFLGITASAQKKFNYEITGNIKGLQNDSLFMYVRLNNKPGTVAKTDSLIAVAKNDHFSFKGSTDRNGLVYAQIGSGRPRSGNFSFFIETGKIKITGSRDSLEEVQVTGTPDNDMYNSSSNIMSGLYKQLRPLFAALKERTDKKDAESEQINARISAIYDSVTTFQREFAKNNPDAMAAGMYVYLLQDKITVNELEALYEHLTDKVRSMMVLSRLPERIAAKKRTAIGSQAPGFAMQDVNGKEISLQDYKGKYVLLDFWASWCVPCRAENPYLVEAHKKYKDKGFNIVSISLDHIGEKWKEAIKQDQLDWTHVSDLRAFDNQIAKLYAVQPIPDNFLIDPAGKIIERGLRGSELESKLSVILK